ncbi:C39 family peptidase [Blautia glucerasea]|uniref:C39 family peptidase n=1 Tax=Blautia glucerasea TaxID=536633 RepID=UPI001D00D4FB|nr:C39 family peptidase [Blautia glucerasea]MCB5386500.1 C39 family peptidase [Blautia glucerasea]MCB5420855.1 C39 family peptidase [Blautia luti]
MIKFLRRAVILLFVFVLGVAGSSFLLNSETTDDRSDMNDPVFPEVMVDFDGEYANRMYGYAQPMQSDFTRDSVTPLDTSRELSLVINPYATKVKSLSYEIRTSDGSKVLENRKVKSLDKNDSYLATKIQINSDLLMNQEYSLQISLETNKGTAYYYTRVVSRSNVNTVQYVKFVKSFYEKCMDKATAEDLTSYLEPDTSNTTTNYTDVGINSTFAEISWGNLSPQIYRKGIPVVKDINETTASFSLEYQIAATNTDGNQEIYDVTEFYRMRYTETRIMLLDFKRSASQVFSENSISISDKGLLLGVRDKNVEYMMNETAGVIAFVQEGDLWSYSPNDGKFSRIFSFRKETDGDFRDSRWQHDIKIIRVEDNGDVDFVLYGYMNRGIREGYSGVCVYHYSNDQNVVEEKAFIPSTESYEFLKKDLGTLSYVSTDNSLFLLFAQKLYQIHITDGKSEVLDQDIQTDAFTVSDTGAHAAWLIQSGESAGYIKEIDFETLETRTLAPSSGQKLTLNGFMNEDLVYGIVVDGDIISDSNGHETTGIHTIRIEGFDGTVKKEYHQDGLYITDVTMGNTMMEFELSKKTKKGYEAVSKDNILNNVKAAASIASIELASNNRTGTQIRLALDEAPEIQDALVVYAKMKNANDDSIILDTQIPEDDIYYVYAKGGLDGIYTDPALAVLRADDQTGVVLNRAQQYVWERGNKKTKLILNLEDVPEAIKSASLDTNALQEALGDEGAIIDLSGCTLDSVLYEISAQRPVIAKTGDNTSVVIIGYDEYNTYLYDPVKGETYPYGMNDSKDLFDKAGNIFISYVEKLNY